MDELADSVLRVYQVPLWAEEGAGGHLSVGDGDDPAVNIDLLSSVDNFSFGGDRPR